MADPLNDNRAIADLRAENERLRETLKSIQEALRAWEKSSRVNDPHNVKDPTVAERLYAAHDAVNRQLRVGQV